MNVLIVDDYKEVIDLTSSLLMSDGHNPIVTDFEKSRKSFLDHFVDAVIVNADPQRYDDILLLRETVKMISPEIPFLVSTVLDTDSEICFLQDSGAQIVNSLEIFQAIRNLK